MKPKLKTIISKPILKSKGVATITTNSFVNNIGTPIGLLLALTYAENLIQTWTTKDNFSSPRWTLDKSLNSPSWA